MAGTRVNTPALKGAMAAPKYQVGNAVSSQIALPMNSHLALRLQQTTNFHPSRTPAEALQARVANQTAVGRLSTYHAHPSIAAATPTASHGPGRAPQANRP